jgi:hypothetical protein
MLEVTKEINGSKYTFVVKDEEELAKRVKLIEDKPQVEVEEEEDGSNNN